MIKPVLPRIISINISKGGIPKLPVSSIRLTPSGLEGDGHNHEKHNRPSQAVCIQDIEQLNKLIALGYQLCPGAAGENLTVENLFVNNLPIGAQLKFSGGVIVEITRARPTCYVMDQIHPKLKEDADGRHGIYARVLQAGFLRAGETIEVSLPSVATSSY